MHPIPPPISDAASSSVLRTTPMARPVLADLRLQFRQVAEGQDPGADLFQQRIKVLSAQPGSAEAGDPAIDPSGASSRKSARNIGV